MATSPSKSTGRTPPFVLVALVLLVFILGYNYWVMSSSNKTLRQMNDRMAIESNDATEKRLAADKSLESSKEEIRVLKGNMEQLKKSLAEKETEVNNMRGEQTKVAQDRDACKASMAKCDKDLQTEKKTVEKVTAEKDKLDKDLKARPTECNIDTCAVPIKEVLKITTKLVGTDSMTKALTEANLDATKLMEGIEKFDPPAQKNV